MTPIDDSYTTTAAYTEYPGVEPLEEEEPLLDIGDTVLIDEFDLCVRHAHIVGIIGSLSFPGTTYEYLIRIRHQYAYVHYIGDHRTGLPRLAISSYYTEDENA